MKGIHVDDPQIAAILEAASTVFAEHGFAGARVDAIARAAGLNKAMLYYRVGDKARLYELVILSHFDRVSGALERAAGEAGKGADPAAALLKVIAGLFREDPRLPR
ncbi:MAG: TetR family transcriptional regulator, partial [Thermodesulfobacteriota bacterium]